MLKIRLRRTGKKKQPSYRVVVAESSRARDAKYVEILGHYNPRDEPITLDLKEERVRYWLDQGAQPSETLHRLFVKQGLWDKEPPKRVTKPSKAELAAAAAAAEAEQAAAEAAEAKAAQAAEAEAAEAADDDASDDAAPEETAPEAAAE